MIELKIAEEIFLTEDDARDSGKVLYLLKQEAIEQIKELRTINKTAKTMQQRQEVIWNEVIISYIMHFNNLIEADLK